MKSCPKCHATYADETLRFCLEDGTPLVFAEEQPTVVRQSGYDPNKTEQLPIAVTQAARDASRLGTRDYTVPPPDPKRSSSLLKVVLVVLGLGFAVLLIAGVAGVAYYVGGRDTANTSTPTPTATPTPAATPSTDDDLAILEREIEKLKKQLEDGSNSNSDIFSGVDTGESKLGRIARVNSPKDGFLALRNLPDHKLGQQIARIPHRAEVQIFSCTGNKTTIDGRSGQWCLVTYEGNVGWVFDAWLNR